MKKYKIILGIVIIIIILISLFFMLKNKSTPTMGEITNEIKNAEEKEIDNNKNDKKENLSNNNIENDKKETTIKEHKINENKASEVKESKNKKTETIKQDNKSQKETTITQKEENKTTEKQGKTGTTKYYIKVNCGAQVVTIYKKDKDGYYNVPIKAMTCSTGTATPKSGTYKIPGRWNWGGLVGGVYGQYVTVITGQILFHSVPYTERYNPGSLQYEEYDKLGTKASSGCIRLTVADALWIHQNCENGTQVEFYSSSNPGPLGKPSTKKISNAKGDLKNWDPTDPDPNNPWKK